MVKKYPWFDIYWDENDVQAVSNIIRRGSFWAAGPEIAEFEELLAKFFAISYCVTFNSGTSALHALLLSLNITSGEVIVPSFSFISTVNCVVLAGATPVFADIETESFGLDPTDVERKITLNTKAILPMHYGGKICKHIKELRQIADRHGIYLIEDNAESFGATLHGKLTGTFGHASILSFCQNKILPTGEGGAVLTNDNAVYEKLKVLRSHGRVEESKINYFENINFMDYIDIGYNYRLPTMAAALGISQLEKIDFLIKKRREIGRYYDKLLSQISEVDVLPELTGAESVYQFYAFLVKDKSLRKPLQEFLKSKEIYTKIQFEPIHKKSSFKNDKLSQELKNTEEISQRILSIPFSLNFTKDDQEYIVSQVKYFFENKEIFI